ncbi:MAG: murein L,D-transpeptidase [Anaerolineae bacterium]|nr:MAG: murein L,D-transpeptidase [Anaerolineae bacterium]
MKLFIRLAVWIVILSGTLWGGAALAAFPGEAEEPYQGTVLCLPSNFVRSPYSYGADCLEAGPAAYQARLRALGITFPLRPLPARPVDAGLGYVPYLYGRVVRERAPVYGSLKDARKGNAKKAVRRLEVGPRGLTYVSYQDQAVVDGKRFYMVSPGNWMTANEVSRITPARFQGLEFYTTPAHDFGWILETVRGQQEPGGQGASGRRTYYRYQVVQVYSSREVDGQTWYLIAPDTWIPARSIGIVQVNTTPPQGVDNGRWIEVNLYEQTLAVYEDGRLRFATLVSTGVEPYWTRPGLFQIYARLETETMRGVFEADRSDYYYLEDVPWTMYFDEARALHGAYWHNGFGYPRSHGCVNMSLPDAHWLFNWAQEGDWVYVWDPSGETPVDPDVYASGGA